MARKSKRVSLPRKTKSGSKRTKRPRSSKKQSSRKRRRTLKKMKNMKGGKYHKLDKYLFTYKNMNEIKDTLKEGDFLFYFKDIIDSQQVEGKKKIYGLVIKVNGKTIKFRVDYKETDSKEKKKQLSGNNNLFLTNLSYVLMKYFQRNEQEIDLNKIWVGTQEEKFDIKINPMKFIKPEQVVPTPNEPKSETVQILKTKEKELQTLQQQLQTLQQQLQTLQKQLKKKEDELQPLQKQLQPLQEENFKQQYPYLEPNMMLYSVSVDPSFLNKYDKDTYVYDDSLIQKMNEYRERINKELLIKDLNKNFRKYYEAMDKKQLIKNY
jgi:hypothetical protein